MLVDTEIAFVSYEAALTIIPEKTATNYPIS